MVIHSKFEVAKKLVKHLPVELGLLKFVWVWPNHFFLRNISTKRNGAATCHNCHFINEIVHILIAQFAIWIFRLFP